MKIYRIYTEDKGSQKILDILTRHSIEGATILLAEGLWKGKTEPSIVIEIISTAAETIYSIAEDIKYENYQESVLVTEQEITAKLV